MALLCCCKNRKANIPPEPDPQHELSSQNLPVQPPPVKLATTSTQDQPLDTFLAHNQPSKTTSGFSSSVKHEVVDPTALDVDDSDGGIEDGENERSSSSSTMGALKSKLIRRLSQKSESKRQSQQTSGSSEEELARRAELRRIMLQRIQEELQREQMEDYQKGKSAAFKHTSRQKKNDHIEPPCGGPRDSIEFSVPESGGTISQSNCGNAQESVATNLPVIQETRSSITRRSSFPGSTCRSREASVGNVEAGLRERGSLQYMPSSPHLEPVHGSSVQGSDSMRSWRLSYSAIELAEYLEAEEPDGLKQTVLSNPNSALGQVKAAKSRTPRRQVSSLASGTESVAETRSSNPDGLQQSVGEIGESKPDLRSSPKSDVPATGTSEIAEDENSTTHSETAERYSPLELWLQIQRLERLPRDSSRQTSIVASENRSESKERSETTSTHEPPLPDHIISNTSVEQRNTTGTFLQVPKSASLVRRSLGVSMAQTKENGRRVPPCVSSGSPGPHCPGALAISSAYLNAQPTKCQDPLENCSSKYRGSSQSQLISSIALEENPSRKCRHDQPSDTEISNTSSYRTAPNAKSTPDELSIAIPGSQQPNSNTTSISASEANSGRMGETESESISRRFNSLGLRRDFHGPVVSRFREDLDGEQIPPNWRSSFLSRLHSHLSLPGKRRSSKSSGRKSEDHPNQQRIHGIQAIGREMLAVDGTEPVPHPPIHVPMDLSTEDGFEPQLNESTTDLWQRAVRREAYQREQKRRNRSVSPGYHDHLLETLSGSKREHEMGEPEPKIDHDELNAASDRLIEPGTSQICQEQNVCNERASSLGGSNQGFQKNDEHAELEDASTAYKPGPAIQIFAKSKARMIPESWAKWPSHNRVERNGAAGRPDAVSSQDFAVTGTIEAGKPKWTTNNLEEERFGGLEPDASPRSLSVKFGRAIRHGFARAVTIKDAGLPKLKKVHAVNNRSLEYPELEVLPHHGGFEEIQALEQQIDHMKRGSVCMNNQFRCLESSSRTAAKTPLSIRIAQDVHMIRDGHHGESTNLEDSVELRKQRSALKRHSAPHIRVSSASTQCGMSDSMSDDKSKLSIPKIKLGQDWKENDRNSHNGLSKRAIHSSEFSAVTRAKRSKSNAERSMPQSFAPPGESSQPADNSKPTQSHDAQDIVEPRNITSDISISTHETAGENH